LQQMQNLAKNSLSCISVSRTILAVIAQSNRSSLYDRYAMGLLLAKEGYAVMMHSQLKINDYYLTLPLVTLYWNAHW